MPIPKTVNKLLFRDMRDKRKPKPVDKKTTWNSIEWETAEPIIQRKINEIRNS